MFFGDFHSQPPSSVWCDGAALAFASVNSWKRCFEKTMLFHQKYGSLLLWTGAGKGSWMWCYCAFRGSSTLTWPSVLTTRAWSYSPPKTHLDFQPEAAWREPQSAADSGFYRLSDLDHYGLEAPLPLFIKRIRKLLLQVWCKQKKSSMARAPDMQ